MLLYEDQNEMLVYRAPKCFDENIPFFLKNRREKALLQISELSRFMNLYYINGPREKKNFVSIYLAPRLFSFLMKHYYFDEYSDQGYSIFGNPVHDLPQEYIDKHPDHLIVATSAVMFGTLKHLEDPSWNKFKVIAKAPPKGTPYAN